MRKHLYALVASVAALLPASQAHAQNWWVDGHVGSSWLEGDSDTTDGGYVSGGGGTVFGVEFDDSLTWGLSAGRNFGNRWSVSLSYDRFEADVDYEVDFVLGSNSRFEGEASSDVLMVNANYRLPLGGEGSRWSVRASGGLGVAFNNLGEVTEFSTITGLPFADIEDGDETSLAARGALRLSYAATERLSLYTEASATRLGDFTTGDSRVVVTTQAIGPYELEAWGGAIGVGAAFSF